MTMRPIERNSWKHVSWLMQRMLSLFGLTVVTGSHSFPWQFPHERISVLRAAQPLQVTVAVGHSAADSDICLRAQNFLSVNGLGTLLGTYGNCASRQALYVSQM